MTNERNERQGPEGTEKKSKEKQSKVRKKEGRKKGAARTEMNKTGSKEEGKERKMADKTVKKKGETRTSKAFLLGAPEIPPNPSRQRTILNAVRWVDLGKNVGRLRTGLGHAISSNGGPGDADPELQAVS